MLKVSCIEPLRMVASLGDFVGTIKFTSPTAYAFDVPRRLSSWPLPTSPDLPRVAYMILFARRLAAVALPVTMAVTVGGSLAPASVAQAAIFRLDLAVATSVLQFQPPATLPDTGTATVTITNVGTVRPFTARVEVDTVSRLNRVTANGLPCALVNLPSGTDVARCTVAPHLIPAPRRSLTLAVVVELSSPPGDCSCVPFTVRLFVPGDSNLSNNIATAAIVR